MFLLADTQKIFLCVSPYWVQKPAQEIRADTLLTKPSSHFVSAQSPMLFDIFENKNLT